MKQISCLTSIHSSEKKQKTKQQTKMPTVTIGNKKQLSIKHITGKDTNRQWDGSLCQWLYIEKFPFQFPGAC